MRDLICISHLRWDFVWQRPQHVLSRLARQYRMFFVEEPICSTEETAPRLDSYVWKGSKGERVNVVRLIQPVSQERWIGHGDALTTNAYIRLLNRYLKSENVLNPVVWLYTPMASDFVKPLNPCVLVYDVMDQLSAFKGAPAELRDREEAMLRQADVVFTGGVSLYRSKEDYNANTHLLPSGVEIEHFAQAADRTAYECPAELADLSRPILGYFGVIDERSDLPLIAHLAQAHPEWSIVMIGPVVKIDPADLPQAPNIHYLGKRTYEQLPAYLAHFDVALIPFAMNEATRYLSPTKTLEYMAAHKPVVSTPIPDVIELYGEVVRIGRTPEEFTKHVETALVDHSEARRARAEALLNQHTWDAIANRMSRLIAAQIEPRAQGWRGYTQPDTGPSLYT
ncbi:MAG: glycosyltransferase family 1 protein, partial [Anaerolineae bacterium]|nr:glycosyltransferase family 1 protein [Anaerolineae bacterium]